MNSKLLLNKTSSKATRNIVIISNVFVDILMSLAILALMVYTIFLISGMANNLMARNLSHSFHDIIFLVVVVKVFKIMQSYLINHHVSVEYILEVAIIASFIEVIFANDQHDFMTVVLLSVFGVANLIIYFLLYKQRN